MTSYVSSNNPIQPPAGAQQSRPIVATAVPAAYFPSDLSGIVSQISQDNCPYNVFSGSASFSIPRPTPCAEYPLRNSFPTTAAYSDTSNSLSKLAICADSIGSVATTQSGPSALTAVGGSFNLTDESTAAAMAAYGTPYGASPYGMPSAYTNLASAGNPYQTQFHQHGLSQYMGNYAAMAAGAAYNQFGWMGGMGGRHPYGKYSVPMLLKSQSFCW